MLNLASWGMAACSQGGLFEDPAARATRDAQGEIYAQTVVVVETQGGTVVALQATANSAAALATQVIQIGSQNQALQATISALASGAPPITAPQAPPGQPSPTAPPPSNGTLSVPTGATIVEASTALGVRDSDGCAQNVSSTFPLDTQRVYMVVRAQGVQAGTTFSTRWLYDGTVRVETVSWTPETSFEEVCIWFFIENGAEVNFESGTWTVEFLVNNQAAVRRDFTIE